MELSPWHIKSCVACGYNLFLSNNKFESLSMMKAVKYFKWILRWFSWLKNNSLLILY